MKYNPENLGVERGNFTELRNQLAYRNIDLNDFITQDMLDELEMISSEEEFYKSKYFKAVVNGYYNSLDENKKKTFFSDLYYSNEVLMIYDALDLEGKENEISDYLKVKLICRDIDTELKKALDMLVNLYMSSSRQFEDCIYAIRDRENPLSIDLSEEEFGEIVKRIEESKSEIVDDSIFHMQSDKKYELAIYSLISSNTKISYLLSNPETLGSVVDSLDEDVVEELYAQITDEALKGRILLSSSKSLDEIKPILYDIDDYFISGQIVLGKHHESEFDEKTTENNIVAYEEIKTKFLSLPLDERIQYLCTIDDGISEEDSIHMLYNEIKKSLIRYIDMPEDRKKVIDSMKRYVEPAIEPYNNLAQQMIREYFEDKGVLTPEMQERMEQVFSSTDVFYTDYEKSSIYGRCSFFDKTITIANHRRGQDLETLLYMTHEYSHAFSNFYWLANAYHPGNTIEEGMADTFSEQVVNHYFEKHKSIEINGNVYENTGTPLESTTIYFFENGVAKTLIYPLEQSGDDAKAIAEYTLGSKKKFVEIALGDEYASQYTFTSLGEPLDFGDKFSYVDIYHAHEGIFRDADRESMYGQKNFLLPAFTIFERAGKRTDLSIEDTRNLQLNNIFIDKAYFDRRRLYEVDEHEYSEFIDLYERANCQQKRFFSPGALVTYIDTKFKELTDQEIEEHSAKILVSSSALLSCITRHGQAVEYVLIEATNNVSQDCEKIESVEQLGDAYTLYTRIYPKIIDVFSQEKNDSGRYLADRLEELRTKMLESMDRCLATFPQEQISEMSYNPDTCSNIPEMIDLMKKYNIRELSEEERKPVHIEGHYSFVEPEIIQFDDKEPQTPGLATKLLDAVAATEKDANSGLRLGEVAGLGFALSKDMEEIEKLEDADR